LFREEKNEKGPREKTPVGGLHRCVGIGKSMLGVVRRATGAAGARMAGRSKQVKAPGGRNEE